MGGKRTLGVVEGCHVLSARLTVDTWSWWEALAQGFGVRQTPTFWRRSAKPWFSNSWMAGEPSVTQEAMLTLSAPHAAV
jgi:hypothetical protein